jgi:hypothetical protein
MAAALVRKLRNEQSSSVAGDSKIHSGDYRNRTLAGSSMLLIPHIDLVDDLVLGVLSAGKYVLQLFLHEDALWVISVNFAFCLFALQDLAETKICLHERMDSHCACRKGSNSR